MAFNALGFTLGSVLAERAGVTDQSARTRLGLFGGLLGSTATGLVVTTELARREAEDTASSDGAPVPGGTPTTDLVPMPDVRGLSLDTARAILETPQVGLVVADIGVVDLKDPKGQVTAQIPEPNAGVQVPAGSTVTLTVSLGFPLPDIVKPTRLSLEEATRELEKLGLKVLPPKEQPDDVIDKGLVISQDPEAGTFVSVNDEVALTVSQGRNEIDLPDFAADGHDFQEVQDNLQNLGLRVARVEAPSDPTKYPDQVVEQEPPAHSKVIPGSLVTLTVNPIEVPDFLAEPTTIQEAREVLQDLELRTRREDVDDDKAPEGQVVGQVPDPHTRVTSGSPVRLKVSKGQQAPRPE